MSPRAYTAGPATINDQAAAELIEIYCDRRDGLVPSVRSIPVVVTELDPDTGRCRIDADEPLWTCTSLYIADLFGQASGAADLSGSVALTPSQLYATVTADAGLAVGQALVWTGRVGFGSVDSDPVAVTLSGTDISVAAALAPGDFLDVNGELMRVVSYDADNNAAIGERAQGGTPTADGTYTATVVRPPASIVQASEIVSSRLAQLVRTPTMMQSPAEGLPDVSGGLSNFLRGLSRLLEPYRRAAP